MPRKPRPNSRRHCTATKHDGTPCKAWAVRNSNPSLCAAHGGTTKQIGAPRGNQNARKGYTLPNPSTPMEQFASAIRELMESHS